MAMTFQRMQRFIREILRRLDTIEQALGLGEDDLDDLQDALSPSEPEPEDQYDYIPQPEDDSGPGGAEVDPLDELMGD